MPIPRQVDTCSHTAPKTVYVHGLYRTFDQPQQFLASYHTQPQLSRGSPTSAPSAHAGPPQTIQTESNTDVCIPPTSSSMHGYTAVSVRSAHRSGAVTSTPACDQPSRHPTQKRQDAAALCGHHHARTHTRRRRLRRSAGCAPICTPQQRPRSPPAAQLLPALPPPLLGCLRSSLLPPTARLCRQTAWGRPASACRHVQAQPRQAPSGGLSDV